MWLEDNCTGNPSIRINIYEGRLFDDVEFERYDLVWNGEFFKDDDHLYEPLIAWLED